MQGQFTHSRRETPAPRLSHIDHNNPGLLPRLHIAVGIGDIDAVADASEAVEEAVEGDDSLVGNGCRVRRTRSNPGSTAEAANGGRRGARDGGRTGGCGGGCGGG